MDFFSDPQSQEVGKREEKEERISEFVSYYIERLAVTDSSDTQERTLTMIAQSPNSPVAKGIAGCMDELICAGVTFQIIYSKLTPSDALSGWIEPELVHRDTFREQGMCGRRVSVVRHARNPALADAHEQLTLGTEMSWAGDSMRREPTKRDAFECYDIDNPESVILARRSFAQLWNACLDVSANSTSRPPLTGSKQAPTIGADAAPGGEKPIRTSKSTTAPSRH